MRKTNTNLSNYDAFRKYSVEEIGNMLGIGKTKKFQQYIDLLHKVVSGQEKTPETISFRGHPERRRPDLNRWILVLQTIALPLGYCAIFN